MLDNENVIQFKSKKPKHKYTQQKRDTVADVRYEFENLKIILKNAAEDIENWERIRQVILTKNW